MSLVVHPRTQLAIENSIKSKPHAILLRGRKGIGLNAIARDIAHKLDSVPLFLTSEDGKPASVDAIRTLYKKTATKKARVQTIILDDADLLSHGAQNALLKLLEEPSKDTVFILVAHHPERILPTIHSRVWPLEISPITRAQTIELLESNGVTEKASQQQFLYMANGRPAELMRLIQDKALFDHRATQIRAAKEFLSSSGYAKLVVVYKLASDRDSALTLINDMAQIVQLSLQTKPTPELIAILERLLEAKEKLLQDGNVRIQLLRLAI